VVNQHVTPHDAASVFRSLAQDTKNEKASDAFLVSSDSPNISQHDSTKLEPDKKASKPQPVVVSQILTEKVPSVLNLQVEAGVSKQKDGAQGQDERETP
ncbi:unnamed protein product, partial [Amoebophrya sp. A25]